jgi:hypothetical protein
VIDESIAHLTHPDGTKFQVLNEDGTDWDEAATYAAYNAHKPSK